MKFLFAFILGLAVGAVATHTWFRQNARPAADVQPGRAPGNITTPARDAADAAVARTRAAAADFSDAFTEKLREWRLTPDDIRGELDRTGSIVRENASRAREEVADVRIVAVIKAKLVLDADLSATAIDADSRNGRVTLTGSVPSEALVGRAVALAMETQGVKHVTARLDVRRQ